MPSSSEFNQLRRWVGDYGDGKVSDEELAVLLNDATVELTTHFATPLTSFDILLTQYHPEVILKAAINFWWDKIGKLQDTHSVSVGGSSSNVSEKWERAMQMIQYLEARFDEINALYQDIMIGNYSRYSKQTLRRIGGIREEDTHA